MILEKYKKKISNIKNRYTALREGRSHLEKLYRISLENMIPITAPIALISQIQRSGGTLLSQLFDGHPEIYAHPDELKIGHPKKYICRKLTFRITRSTGLSFFLKKMWSNISMKGIKKGTGPKKRFLLCFHRSCKRRFFCST